ncbi:MAG: M1 family aminopeptidase [Bacteroidetes bacterium]|nr:M1 family aminopeptidase [Bacteroidota bacterium]
MKRSLFLILSALFLFSFAYTQNNKGITGSQSCSLRKSNLKWIPAKPVSHKSAVAHTFDVQNYTLDLDIYDCFSTPYPNSFSGSNVVTFKVDSTLSAIQLNAVNTSLVIDSVGLAGSSFSHEGDMLAIYLDRTYTPGEIVQVKVIYHHNNVVDNAFNVQGGMVFTDAEPEGARRWFPCWDKPSDKATLDMKVKVPSTVKVGSNGMLHDSVQTDDTLVYHWISTDRLSTYLVVISAKVNYNLDIIYWHKLNNPNDSVPFRFYYNAGENPSAIENVIGPMTTYYSEHFCEHPHPKNGFASLNPLFYWGGMENQTLTSICQNCWQEGLISHEFAHQWFGDMITCKTWADIWVNEGFATWVEALWDEYYGGYGAYKASINSDAAGYFSGNTGWAISVPDWAYNTPSVDVLFNYSMTYEKGACALHQLRYLLGDSMFFATLHSYCMDTNLRFGNASVRDFNDKVNLVTGKNYDWYFNAWIFQPNHPVYDNSYNFQDLGLNNWRVNFLAKQVQTNAPFFPMLLQVKVYFEDNSDTTFTIMNDENNQGFFWNVNKQPVTFRFDPDNQVVLKQGSTTNRDIVAIGNDTMFLTAVQNNYGNIIIIANTDWSVQGDVPDWLSVNKTSGTGFDTLIFHTTQVNPTGSQRVSGFVLSSAIETPKPFTVIQLPIPGGIDEKNADFVKVYPNPSINGIVHLQSEFTVKTITISDSRGMFIRQVRVNDKRTTLDLSKEARGLYFLRITTGTRVSNKKIMVL